MSILIALIGSNAFASEPIDCFYSARATSEITLHRRCATVQRDGSIRILSRHLRNLDFGTDSLATLALKGGRWFYVKRNGQSLEVLPWDNGADPFADGLVRGRRRGKVAFFDRSFRMVLPATYDFAWPFEDGLALVCSGCKEEPVAPDREHRALVGGLWGYIDRRGNEVIPVKYSRDEAVRRKEQLRRR